MGATALPGHPWSLGGSLTFDLLLLRLPGFPLHLDAARPQDLRYLAHELDGEQAIRQAGPHDLDVIRELEALLERACSDAAVQGFSFRARRIGVATLTFNEQQVPLGGDR